MDPVRNPYAPGSGRKPAALVGRDGVLDGWSVSLQRAEAGTIDPPFVLYGLRGVGKTVLLSQLGRDARDRDWIVAQIEAGSGRSLRELLGEALYEPLSDLSRPSAGKRLLRALKTAASFKASYDSTGQWTFGVDLSDIGGGGADSGILSTDLRKIIKDVSLAAWEEGSGLAILIDESQDLERDELTTLAAIAHAAAQEGWPVLFAFAGLPSLPQILAEARSYTERFRFEPIMRLREDDAARAVIEPAEMQGVQWAPEAVAHLVAGAGRYPYFIQQFGQESWKFADASPITLTDARLGVLEGLRQLDNGFFRARWDRATKSEKRYLRAMCPEGDDGVASSVVAERLGKSLQSLGPTRAKLIHKGLVYAPDHGVVGFTVPGMAHFIKRQPEDTDVHSTR